MTSRGLGRAPGEVPAILHAITFPLHSLELTHHPVYPVLVSGLQQASIGHVAGTLHRVLEIVAAAVEGAEALVVAQVPLADVHLVGDGTASGEGP